jgi:hypothetical protein
MLRQAASRHFGGELGQEDAAPVPRAATRPERPEQFILAMAVPRLRGLDPAECSGALGGVVSVGGSEFGGGG